MKTTTSSTSLHDNLSAQAEGDPTPDQGEPTTAPPRLDELPPLESLRLKQNFAETVGVRKLVNTIPVRKAHRQEFVRVRSGADYRFETAALVLKEERDEIYLVAPDLWPDLTGELTPMVLFTAINRQGVLFLWPVRLPGEDGRHNPWHASALDAAKRAETHWVRVQANTSLGAYEMYEAAGSLPEPDWPPLSMAEIVKVAFRGRYIPALDHPVIRRLRGAQ
jgi:hypothetical protein